MFFKNVKKFKSLKNVLTIFGLAAIQNPNDLGLARIPSEEP
jgi:hypothetical protein